MLIRSGNLVTSLRLPLYTRLVPRTLIGRCWPLGKRSKIHNGEIWLQPTGGT